MSKTKGSNAERELIHLLWQAGWAAVRVSGSGSMKYPSPDILASREGRQLVFECKATKAEHKYLTKDEVHALLTFAERSGAEPWIALRFARTPWLFIGKDLLSETKEHYVIWRGKALREGQSLERVLNL